MIAQLAGYQVGFDDSGDGLPVVFLHGFPHDRTLWTAQRVSLAPHVRCIVPDLRGFGHSSTFGPFSMEWRMNPPIMSHSNRKWICK